MRKLLVSKPFPEHIEYIDYFNNNKELKQSWITRNNSSNVSSILHPEDYFPDKQKIRKLIRVKQVKKPSCPDCYCTSKRIKPRVYARTKFCISKPMHKNYEDLYVNRTHMVDCICVNNSSKETENKKGKLTSFFSKRLPSKQLSSDLKDNLEDSDDFNDQRKNYANFRKEVNKFKDHIECGCCPCDKRSEIEDERFSDPRTYKKRGPTLRERLFNKYFAGNNPLDSIPCLEQISEESSKDDEDDLKDKNEESVSMFNRYLKNICGADDCFEEYEDYSEEENEYETVKRTKENTNKNFESSDHEYSKQSISINQQDFKEWPKESEQSKTNLEMEILNTYKNNLGRKSFNQSTNKSLECSDHEYSEQSGSIDQPDFRKRSKESEQSETYLEKSILNTYTSNLGRKSIDTSTETLKQIESNLNKVSRKNNESLIEAVRPIVVPNNSVELTQTSSMTSGEADVLWRNKQYQSSQSATRPFERETSGERLRKIKDFRNKNFFETHNVENFSKDIPKHTCVQRMCLDDRGVPVCLDPDVYGNCRCAICEKPMKRNLTGERRTSKTDSGIKRLSECYTFGLVPKPINMGNNGKIEMFLTEKDVLVFNDYFKSKYKRPQYKNTLALRQQKMLNYTQ